MSDIPAAGPLWPGGPAAARWSEIRRAAITSGFPDATLLPETCPAGRDGEPPPALLAALEWLAVVAGVQSVRVHDFDPADPHGRCRRPGCGVPFLDAGAECPGSPPASLPADGGQ